MSLFDKIIDQFLAYAEESECNVGGVIIDPRVLLTSVLVFANFGFDTEFNVEFGRDLHLLLASEAETQFLQKRVSELNKEIETLKQVKEHLEYESLESPKEDERIEAMAFELDLAQKKTRILNEEYNLLQVNHSLEVNGLKDQIAVLHSRLAEMKTSLDVWHAEPCGKHQLKSLPPERQSKRPRKQPDRLGY